VTDQIGSGDRPATGQRLTGPKNAPGAACATLPQIAVAIVWRHLAVEMIETALVTGQRPADTSHVVANQKPRYGDCTQRPSVLNPLDQTYRTGIRSASVGSDVVLMKQCNPVNIKTMSDRLVAATNVLTAPCPVPPTTSHRSLLNPFPIPAVITREAASAKSRTPSF